jgi:hypothetical protein
MAAPRREGVQERHQLRCASRAAQKRCYRAEPEAYASGLDGRVGLFVRERRPKATVDRPLEIDYSGTTSRKLRSGHLLGYMMLAFWVDGRVATWLDSAHVFR